MVASAIDSAVVSAIRTDSVAVSAHGWRCVRGTRSPMRLPLLLRLRERLRLRKRLRLRMRQRLRLPTHRGMW